MYTTINSPSHHRTQIPWGNIRPRTKMDCTCQLCTFQRHKVCNPVLPTSQDHKGNICQIYEKILHNNCHPLHVIHGCPFPYPTDQTSQWVKRSHKKTREGTMTSCSPHHRGPANDPHRLTRHTHWLTTIPTPNRKSTPLSGNPHCNSAKNPPACSPCKQSNKEIHQKSQIPITWATTCIQDHPQQVRGHQTILNQSKMDP